MKENLKNQLKNRIEKFCSRFTPKQQKVFLTVYAAVLGGAFFWVLGYGFYTINQKEKAPKLPIEHIDSSPLIAPNDTLIPKLKTNVHAKG